MEQSPSLLRIIKVDYLALLGVLLPAVTWGVGLVTQFLDPDTAAFFLFIAQIVTVPGLLLLWWRVRTIRKVFTDGDETPGVITGIFFYRDRGRVEYAYTYQGQEYRSSNAIHSTGITRSLVPGQTVTVMVDSLNPKRAFVRELYVEENTSV